MFHQCLQFHHIMDIASFLSSSFCFCSDRLQYAHLFCFCNKSKPGASAGEGVRNHFISVDYPMNCISLKCISYARVTRRWGLLSRARNKPATHKVRMVSRVYNISLNMCIINVHLAHHKCHTCSFNDFL